MVRAVLVFTGAVICGSAVVYTQQSSARLASDLVLLNVTVTDAAGRLVPGLSAADFHLTENGRAQELTLFLRGSAPRSLLLLVDSSSSMDEEMSDVRQALEKFVRELPPQTSVELVDFDVRPKVLQPLTGDGDRVAAAVKRLRGGGSTSLYNALYVTFRQLPVFPSGMPSELLRTVLVVSDGDDTSSLVAFDTLLDAVTRSHTQIHAIGLHASEREHEQPHTPTKTPRNPIPQFTRSMAVQSWTSVTANLSFSSLIEDGDGSGVMDQVGAWRTHRATTLGGFDSLSSTSATIRVR